jgi:hypothetical protein
MKKYLLLALFFTLCLTITTQAQDVILKVTGDEIKAKVMEITLAHVVYKLPEKTQDSLHVLDRKEVFMVTFANGTKEVLNQDTVPSEPTQLTPTQMALLGKKDAKIYYKGNGAMWGSALATWAFFPALVVVAAVPPKVNAREVSDFKYLSDPYYKAAYKKQAHKRKLGKVAMGAGIGVVTFSAVSMMLLLSSYQ